MFKMKKEETTITIHGAVIVDLENPKPSTVSY